MKQYLMALTKRGIRPASRGNPPDLDVDTTLNEVAINPTRVFKVDLTAPSDNTAGAAVSWANPLGVDCVVGQALLVLDTGDDGITLDIGVAADGETSSDTIFDGVGVGTADQGEINNIDDGGTNGVPMQILEDDEYITGTASGDGSDLVGSLYITLTPVTTG